MKNINYRVILCIGLLSLNAFSSCTNTRQAMKPREEMKIHMPGNAEETHNKKWGWRQWFVWGLAGSSGIGGLGGLGHYLYSNTGMSSPSTGLNNTDTDFPFLPENIHGSNSPQAEMLRVDMSNTTEHYKDLAISLINTVKSASGGVSQEKTDKIISLIQEIPQEFLGLQDDSGQTALMHSISNRKGWLSVLLLENMDIKSLNIQAKPALNHTALMLALMNDLPYTATLLIKKMDKEGLTLKNDYGSTALSYAVACHKRQIVELLVDKIDQKDFIAMTFPYKTPLMHAIEKGYRGIAKLLIRKMNKKGLSLRDFLKNSSGQTALMYAIEKGYTDIAKLLIEKINKKGLDKKDNNGKTALDHAREIGDTDIINSLEKKINKNKNNSTTHSNLDYKKESDYEDDNTDEE